jgi:hypothetical protein
LLLLLVQCCSGGNLDIDLSQQSHASDITGLARHHV